jgi:glycosyltransferase involved in cell wall biosynthesis
MANRLKLAYISSIAAPHQVKLCNALQAYLDARFFFYESAARTRAAWWTVALEPHSKLLQPVFFFKSGPLAQRYFAPGLTAELATFNPDIVVLGGFSIPSNYLAYRWARRHGKKTVIFTERSRSANGQLRRRSLLWLALKWLYRDVDMVMTSADDAVAQFRDEFRFGDKVVPGRYAADLDAYFDHPLRTPRPHYTYLFANRLTDIYDPMKAIEIFARILERNPGSRLLMNAVGEQRDECERRIDELGISNSVSFLTTISSWEQLNDVYRQADILLLPAKFSNGNFTILEAMASGMGIVISDQVLGIGGMVEDGKNGFRCEPTVDAFVERLETYIRKPDLLRTHALMNRPVVQPLSAAGTANFMYGEMCRMIEQAERGKTEVKRTVP